MNDVVLHILNAHDQVTQYPGIGRNLYTQGIFYGTDAGHRMNSRADTTETLGKVVGITWIATFEYCLNSTERRR